MGNKSVERHGSRKWEFSHIRLRGYQILCEECGAVYDRRDGTGLCRFCTGDEFHFTQLKQK